MIRITVASVFVEDQRKALAFYTDVLGFVKKREIPLGEASWLTVVSPGDPDGVELLLEPNANPIARTYQKALFEAGIPATTFAIDDIHAEYARMVKLGVVFQGEPVQAGEIVNAVLNDTCGNLIGLHQPV
jgi:catechol 2,3-dioxygenase-like lactoylglutathione lyase family enzyme